MPHSKSLGFIYVAIPKTGSTSFIRALKQLQKVQEGELQLLKEPITKGFRRRYRLDEIGDPRPGRAKHLSAIQLKYILGDEEFSRCLKLSLVRNPWARTVSQYFFTRKDVKPNFLDRVRRGTTRKFHNLGFEAWVSNRWIKYQQTGAISSQLSKLTDLEGNLLIDHVGRLEDVQATLDWLTGRLGVERIGMPHVNRATKGYYASYYTPRTRGMVEEMCREDIEYFKYQFEQ